MAGSAEKPLHVVVGASGPLGKWVVQTLLERGDVRVRAVSRSGGGEHGTEVESVAADALDHDQIIKACEGASVIYHTMNTPYPVWKSTLPVIMEGIVAAAEVADAKVVYGDNVYCYGKVDGPLHEDLPWATKTKKGKVRKEVLDILMRAHHQRIIRATVGMASDFYGPEVTNSHFGEFMIPNLLAGKAGLYLGNPDLPHSFTYIEDFARDLVTLAMDQRADGRTWHTRLQPPARVHDLVQQLGEMIRKPAKLNTMPPWLLAVMGIFSPMMREIVEMLYQFRKPFIVSDSAFRETFGDTAPTSFEEGLKATLEWYRKQA